MKKWEKPELMILGVENTKTDLFGSNNNRPDWCFCKEFQDSLVHPHAGNGVKYHNHGAWKKDCPCCQREDNPGPTFS